MKDYVLFIDSGIGGTHLLKLTKKLLPHESFLYFADTPNLPYGNKSKNKITKLVIKAIEQVLCKYPLKMIVLACNTATATSIASIRQKFDIPIVGIEPAIKKALDFGHKNILVIATSATTNHSNIIKKYKKYPYISGLFLKPKIKYSYTRFKPKHNILKSYAKTTKNTYHTNYPVAKLIIKKDRHLANLIEVSSPHLLKYLKKYKKYAKCDAVVLGCTHYVFATEILGQIFENAQFYESSPFVAKRIKEVLTLNNTLNQKGHGKTIFL